jgi:hypothetical protein
LVVIIIILILMSLLLVGINKIWIYVDEVKTGSEINQLAQACELFKSTYGRYPPSRIRLYENCAYTNRNGPIGNFDADLERYSLEYLSAIFPGINLTPTANGGTGQDWNGDGAITAGAGGIWDLEGDECLVYFLGGLPRCTGTPGQGLISLIGFHTDKANPIQPITNAGVSRPGSTRSGPFYEFKQDRLRVNNGPTPATMPGRPFTHPVTNVARNNRLPVYLDYYGVPYAYFLAMDGGTNNYNCYLINTTAGATQPFRSYPTRNDCSILCGQRFVPYYVQATTAAGAAFTAPLFPANAPANPPIIEFFGKSKFQIISAGRDQLFGTGGHFDSREPEASQWNRPYGGDWTNGTNPIITSYNFDNITNFTGGRIVP